MTAGRPIDIEVDGGVGPDVSCQLAAGANALVAGSAVFKGGTMESYKANIAAIRNAALLARGRAKEELMLSPIRRQSQSSFLRLDAEH